MGPSKDAPLGELLGMDAPEKEELLNNSGLVTQGQREFLYAPDKIESNSASTYTMRVRNRVQQALFDFQYLQSLGQSDLQLIVESLPDGQHTAAFRGPLTFLWDLSRQDPLVDFELAIKKAIEHERSTGSLIQSPVVDVDIDVTRGFGEYDKESLLEKLDEEESLSDEQLGFLIRHCDPDEREYVLNQAIMWSTSPSS